MKHYDIPETWRWVKLGAVADIVGGGTPSRENPTYFSGDILWATPTDVTALDGKWINETRERITQQGLENSSARLVPVGTVLMTSRATIGATAIAGQEMATNQGFANFICDEQTLFNEYLAYYLPFIKDWLIQIAGGTTFKEISKSILAKIDIPLPTLTEQYRLAEILRVADDLARLRKRSERLHARLPRSIFASIFGTPSVWTRTKPITEYGKFAGGGTPPRQVKEFYSGTIPWITPKDMGERYITGAEEHITETAIQKSAAKQVPASTILLVVKSKILSHTLPISIVTVPAAFNQDIKGFVCNDQVTPSFILGAVQAQEAQILQQARGANTEGLTLEILRDVQIPESTTEKHSRFSELIRTYDHWVIWAQRANTRTDTVIVSCFALAFTGKLTAQWRASRLKLLRKEAVAQAARLDLDNRKASIARSDVEDSLSRSMQPLLDQLARSFQATGETVKLLQQKWAEQLVAMIQPIKMPTIELLPIFSLAFTSMVLQHQEQFTEIASSYRSMVANLATSVVVSNRAYFNLADRILNTLEAWPSSDHPRYDLVSNFNRQQKFLLIVCETEESYFTVETIQGKLGMSTDTIQRNLEMFASLGLILEVTLSAQTNAGKTYSPAFRSLKDIDQVRSVDLLLLEEKNPL